MWLRMYHRMGNGITLLHSCHLHRQATAPVKLLSWMLIWNNNEVWKKNQKNKVLSSACWIQWRVSIGKLEKLGEILRLFCIFYWNFSICNLMDLFVCAHRYTYFLKGKTHKVWQSLRYLSRLQTERKRKWEYKREKRDKMGRKERKKEGRKLIMTTSGSGSVTSC